MGFKEMKMMKSTEPSVDEAGKGMKKGGKTKMQMGGAMPTAPLAAAAQPMGRRPMPSRPAMGRPAMGRRPDPRAAMLEAAMAQRAGAGAALHPGDGGRLQRQGRTDGMGASGRTAGVSHDRPSGLHPHALAQPRAVGGRADTSDELGPPRLRRIEPALCDQSGPCRSSRHGPTPVGGVSARPAGPVGTGRPGGFQPAGRLRGRGVHGDG